ncbi:DUF1919 domain-containing protein [Enterocloster lavalensis]|uniref:DUF1919 domain-containing protein n=1 Tax=Enterocloster lavalensis TaxID=460384 RepID=UPI002666679A|nr:DUF1919 domain-containing protein [Enterocloster lavalensis]
MPTLEGIRLKLLMYPRTGKLFTSRRIKQLKYKDFTIISNNCWGGMIYESYGLSKQSPTVGLFFMASDYIRFVSDLKAYTTGEIKFINPQYSKWKDVPQVSGDSRFGLYPVGVVSNGKEEVEIFFLHYHSEEEAIDKWKRRCERVNYEKLLVKFNDQNGCSEENLCEFLALPYKNKIFFTCKDWNVQSEAIIKIRQLFNKKFIQASYEPFGRNRKFDVTDCLNKLV